MKYSVRTFLRSDSLKQYERKTFNETKGPFNIFAYETHNHVILRFIPVMGVLQGSNHSMKIYVGYDRITELQYHVLRKLTSLVPALTTPLIKTNSFCM